MYLDTGARGMELWPIYGFPLTSATQTLNVATLSSLNATILGLINDPVAYSGPAAASTNLGQITVPGALTQPNRSPRPPPRVPRPVDRARGRSRSRVSR